ncbi:PQQ-dependent sugar dehydrogenase [Paenibacillus elgii]|nr:PQQ-dependent sugar dehydrogenase [Paenibacillus elgii]NEN87251.1 PQQ-dependent sugar dehydrogenase [Paenibacillus elgii]
MEAPAPRSTRIGRAAGIDLAPDGRIFFTERGGALCVIDKES